MLPQQYQVMMAAGLSVALGIILSFGNRKKPIKASEENQSNESQEIQSKESE